MEISFGRFMQFENPLVCGLPVFSHGLEGDLLPANPCPRKKRKFKLRDVVPLSYNQMDRLEAAVEKMHSPGWNDARRLKMRLLIQIMRWSGMALWDAVCLPRVELVKRTISSRRHKTDKWLPCRFPNRWPPTSEPG